VALTHLFDAKYTSGTLDLSLGVWSNLVRHEKDPRACLAEPGRANDIFFCGGGSFIFFSGSVAK